MSNTFSLNFELLSAKIFILFFVCSCLILPFSPFFTYILLLVGLIIFSYKINKILSYTAFLLACFSQFYILHSKNYIVEREFDLGNYYYSYSDLMHSSIGEASNYSLEIGWYAVYKIIGFFNHNLNIFDIALINSMICIALFFIWLVKYGSREIEPHYLGFVLGIIALFMWPSNFPFFQRQSISVAILLFAISNIKNFRNFIFFLILASLFHATSFAIGLIYYILVSYNIKNLVKKMIISLIIFRFLFSVLLTYIMIFFVNADLIRKVSFYAEGDGNLFLAFSELRFFPLFILIFIFYKKIDSEWKNIIVFSALFYISLIGIQFASGRFNFILVYLYGYFLWLVTKKQPYILFVYALFYFIFDILYKSNFILLLSDPFWQRYPLFSLSPFYYLGY